MLLLHYSVKFKIIVWPFTTMNSYWVAHASALSTGIQSAFEVITVNVLFKSLTYLVTYLCGSRYLRYDERVGS